MRTQRIKQGERYIKREGGSIYKDGGCTQHVLHHTGLICSAECMYMYMFCTIQEYVQSQDCITQFWNPDNAVNLDIMH